MGYFSLMKLIYFLFLFCTLTIIGSWSEWAQASGTYGSSDSSVVSEEDSDEGEDDDETEDEESGY